MGTRHDEQAEIDIILTRPKEFSSDSTNHRFTKDAPYSGLNREIKREIFYYHTVLTTNQLYLFLFTIGIIMDTLLLFVPVINEDKKCVIIENKVKIVALIMHLVTDIFFLERILHQVLVTFGRSKNSWVCYFNILIDALDVAPFPQVIIVLFFTGVGSPKQLIKWKALNFIIMFQYFPRTLKIYLTYLRIKKSSFISPKVVIFWNLFFFFGLCHSSCGQNLRSSGYMWETCFAALITTSGLLLCLYFIGQVQVYNELLTYAITKEKWQEMKWREIDVDVWLNNNNIPNKDKIKETLMRQIRYMQEIKDIHLKILLPLLSAQERRSVKSWLCHPILKKVATLQNMDNKMLEEITYYLKPVIYSENSYIICEGKSLDFMLLITQGVIRNFKPSVGNNNSVNIMGNCKRILKGNVYGEELLERIFKSAFIGVGSYSDILISDTNVKAHTKVEAFAIMENDISIIVNRFKIRIIHDLAKSGKFDLKLAESIAASFIQSTVRWRHRRYDQNNQF